MSTAGWIAVGIAAWIGVGVLVAYGHHRMKLLHGAVVDGIVRTETKDVDADYKALCEREDR